MNWRTHALVGANAVWIASAVYPVTPAFAWLIAVGAFAGLAPDIDAVQAKIHYLGGGFLGIFKGAFKHRAFFHSILCAAIVYALVWFFLRQYHPALPLVAAAGYASHPLIDGFNIPGVEYLFPVRVRYHLLPKSLRTPVGGFVDQLLLVLACFGLLYFVLSYATLLQGSLMPSTYSPSSLYQSTNTL